MNQHMDASVLPSVTKSEFVLAALRCTSARVKLIDNEISFIGVALRGGVISPEAALEWAAQVAPGCVNVVAGSVLEGPQ